MDIAALALPAALFFTGLPAQKYYKAMRGK
jgi:hypothetical protein